MGIVDTIYYNYCKPSLIKLIQEILPQGNEILELEKDITEMPLEEAARVRIQRLCPNLIEKFASFRGEKSMNKFKEAISINIKNLFQPFVQAIVKSKLSPLYFSDLQSLLVHAKSIKKTSEAKTEEPRLSQYPTKKPKQCMSSNPLNEIIEYKCVSEGIKCNVKCLDCKKQHEILYKYIPNTANVIHKKMNDFYTFYSSPCIKCNKLGNHWNDKIVLHKNFTKDCVLCRQCAVYTLRNQCNEMAFKNKQFLYECNCHVPIKDILAITSLMGSEMSHHYSAVSAENHDKMVCINCANLVTMKSSDVNPAQVKCEKCQTKAN